MDQHFGMGFDPVADRIRLIVAESGANYSISPDDGTAILEERAHYAADDPNAGRMPAIAGLGYVPSNGAAGSAAMQSQAPPLVEGAFLAIDADLDRLIFSLDPKTGEFQDFGSIDLDFGACAEVKIEFDPQGVPRLFAVLLTGLGNLITTLDPATGPPPRAGSSTTTRRSRGWRCPGTVTP